MKLLRTLTFSSIIAGCITGCGSDSDNELADLSGSKKFTLEEATIADLQDAFKYKKVITDTGKPATCENVAEAYLSRIDMYDKKESTEGKSFQSIIAINPTWRDQAKELDRRYSSGGPVGRLHCVPVLLKDLYDTYDFPTTSSSLALLGSQPPDDAFTVSKLRAQGSLILGKTTMTEFAFFTQSYNSRTGRVLLAMRDNESAVAAYGVSPTKAKLMAFAISGFFASTAGALVVHHQQALVVESNDHWQSIDLFVAAVAGGIGSVIGAVLGALYYWGGVWWLPGNWRLLVLGGGVLGVLLILPGGAKAMEYLRQEKTVLDIISNFYKKKILIGSICHGAQLLISANVVKDKKISGYYSLKDDVNNAGAIYSSDGCVEDNGIITSPHYKFLGEWMKAIINKFDD